MFLKLVSTVFALLITGLLGSMVMLKQAYKRLLGLRTIFNPGLNELKHDYQGFHLPAGPLRAYRRILFWRMALNKPHLFQKKAQQVHEEFLNHIKKNNWAPQPVSQLETVDWARIESDKDWFYDNHVVKQIPCVIKGFPVDPNWSIEYIRKIWGDKPMLVHEILQSSKTMAMTLNEMVEHNQKGGCAYMSFNRSFFDANRELVANLNPAKFINVLKKSKRDLKNVDTQLFISTYTPTDEFAGSVMHCANNINMFFNLEGRKNWLLVDPEFTPACYPYGYLREKGVMMSLVSYGKVSRDDDAKDIFPLLKYVPRYSVDLEPGDVLYIPCWWWHTVETLTKDTLSVALRLGPVAFGSLFPASMKDPNSLFTTLQTTSFGMYQEVFRVMYTRAHSKLSAYKGAHLRELDIKTETQKDAAGAYAPDRVARVAAWAKPKSSQ